MYINYRANSHFRDTVRDLTGDGTTLHNILFKLHENARSPVIRGFKTLRVEGNSGHFRRRKTLKTSNYLVRKGTMARRKNVRDDESERGLLSTTYSYRRLRLTYKTWDNSKFHYVSYPLRVLYTWSGDDKMCNEICRWKLTGRSMCLNRRGSHRLYTTGARKFRKKKTRSDFLRERWNYV